MLEVQDRIKELTTTSGTGTLQLSGSAEAGFQAFSVLSNLSQTFYTIIDVNGVSFETGIGTYTTSGNTLSRDTILSSSNSNNAIVISATGSTVFVTYPAVGGVPGIVGYSNGAITKGKAVVVEASGDVAQVASSSSGDPKYNPDTQQISGANTDLSSASVQRIADNGAGTFCVVFEYSNGHDAMIGVDNGTSITWGGEENMLTGGDGGATVYYDPDEDKFIVTCMNESLSLIHI